MATKVAVAIRYIPVLLASIGFMSACHAAGMKKQQGGDISINAGGIHPIEVGAITPSGRFIFLRVDGKQCQGMSLVGTSIVIHPSRSAAMEFVDGKQHVVATFSELGNFKIWVADNLETEFENSNSFSTMYRNKVVAKPGIGPESCAVEVEK